MQQGMQCQCVNDCVAAGFEAPPAGKFGLF
jgi:hypothetical protein